MSALLRRMRGLVFETVSDLAQDFARRKDDPELSREALCDLIRTKKVTLREIVAEFERALDEIYLEETYS